MFARLTAIDGGLQLVNVLQIGTVGPRVEGGSNISVMGVNYHIEVEQNPDQVDEACKEAIRRYSYVCCSAAADMAIINRGR